MRSVAVFVAMALCPAWASAESPEEERSRFAVELDPLNYVFRGFNLAVGIKPADLPHWQFTVGTFASNLTPGQTEFFNSDNAGWQHSYQAYVTHVDYFFGSERKGFFASAFGGVLYNQIELLAIDERAHFTSLMISPQIGFQWFPFKTGLYLTLRLGIAYSPVIAGSRSTGGRDFRTAVIGPAPLPYIGWEF